MQFWTILASSLLTNASPGGLDRDDHAYTCPSPLSPHSSGSVVADSKVFLKYHSTTHYNSPNMILLSCLSQLSVALL